MTTRRNMLPGALLEEPGAKRTARDWLVDLTMFAARDRDRRARLRPSEDQHGDLAWR